jgi:nucleoside-diphosphate-sugar epimerase
MKKIEGGEVLVTGGSGFIGSYVIDALKDQYDIVVVDITKPNVNGVTFKKIDLKKPFSISNDFKFCIHLAGFVGGIQYFTKHPVENVRDNPRMTANVFDACVSGGVRQVIYTSSSVVYQYQKKFPTKEEDVYNSPPPSSAYGISKLLGEYFCSAYYEQFGLNYTVLRPFNAYGPREAPDPDYAHVIPQLIDKVLQNQYPVKLYGTGNQTRTFTHGSDIARAFKLSLEKKSALNQIFNVSGDAELKIIHVLEKIWEFTSKRKKLRVKHLSPLKDDVQRRYPSNKKIKKILGWKPEVKFDDGLKETISWVQNNKYKN